MKEWLDIGWEATKFVAKGLFITTVLYFLADTNLAARESVQQQKEVNRMMLERGCPSPPKTP